MTIVEIPPGIYRIVVAGSGVDGVEPQAEALTRHDYVTIRPPNEVPDPEQKWRIRHGKEPGNITIELPSDIIPTSYLTYKGAPEKPKEGDRIECRLYPLPLIEWHPAIAPGRRYLLRVAGSELGIKVAPPKIEPPFLELGLKEQLEWVFDRIDLNEEVSGNCATQLLLSDAIQPVNCGEKSTLSRYAILKPIESGPGSFTSSLAMKVWTAPDKTYSGGPFSLFVWSEYGSPAQLAVAISVPGDVHSSGNSKFELDSSEDFAFICTSFERPLHLLLCEKCKKFQKFHPLFARPEFTMVFHRISVVMKEQALALLEDGWNIEETAETIFVIAGNITSTCMVA
ncbi:hypothetical protein AX14_004049 [Amanita brunnescens Koide BX004]|nr:hypothetical protein AX14_004049 [Amanita brunnescens Koide BX004]